MEWDGCVCVRCYVGAIDGTIGWRFGLGWMVGGREEEEEEEEEEEVW